MTNKKVTRRALLMSVTSLLICISMLLGTTFAWFTDEVTSGVNRIVAGNLDVELTHKSANVTTAESVASQTNLFRDKDGKEMLWEPGAVAYETFEVKNVGTLALKYKMNLNIYDYNTTTLNGVKYDLRTPLKVLILTGNDMLTDINRTNVQNLNWNNAQSLESFAQENAKLYPVSSVPENEKSADTFQVVVYWQPRTDDNNWNLNNERQGNSALYIKFGVNLVATQLDYEKDSFDDQYDAGTTLPALVSVGSQTITASSTEDIVITKSGAIESATVPAAAANAVFNSMATAGASNELTMNLNVAKTGETATATGTTVDLDIDMTAVMKTTVGNDTTTTTKDVKNLDAYVTINYNLGTGKNVTGATHNGNAMELLTSTDATPTNENGGYYYDSTNGILTIKTKSFSPFAVSYKTLITALNLNSQNNDIGVGQTLTITATIIPSNANATINWSSDNENVATVVANGTECVVKGIAGGKATITATADDITREFNVTVYDPNNLIDLADVDEILSVDNINITPDNEHVASKVKSTNATINADNLTFDGLTVECGGLTLNGNNIKVQNVNVNQSYGSGSTFSLTGGGNYTVTNSTFTHGKSATGGRYGALYFEGATINDQTAAKATETTVDHVTIGLSYDAVIAGYPENIREQVRAALPEDPHDLGDYVALFMNSNSGGLIYRNLGGTLNVSNSTIDTPYSALQIGIDAEPRYGWVNVTDSTINTTSMGFEHVDYTTFKNVTFKNDWTTEPVQISTGSSYQGDLNYIFEDSTFGVKGLKIYLSSTGADNVHNPKITFKNCTINNTTLNEENYESVITSFLTFGTNQSTHTGKIQNLVYNGETNTVTFTVARVAK